MDVKKPITSSMTSGIIPSAPLTRQPTRIAPQQLDELTLRWLRQMHQPVPTVQATPPPMEVLSCVSTPSKDSVNNTFFRTFCRKLPCSKNSNLSPESKARSSPS